MPDHSNKQIGVHTDGVMRKHWVEARRYYDPAWYEREKRLVFRKAWQIACRADQVAGHGDFHVLAARTTPC